MHNKMSTMHFTFCFIRSNSSNVDNADSDARGVTPGRSLSGEANTETEVIHYGVKCDGCGMDPITGIRYRVLS